MNPRKRNLLPAAQTVLPVRPRTSPFGSALPHLPARISDELLDVYGFLFCQRGFRDVGLTFEQFLLVIAALKPGDL